MLPPRSAVLLALLALALMVGGFALPDYLAGQPRLVTMVVRGAMVGAGLGVALVAVGKLRQSRKTGIDP